MFEAPEVPIAKEPVVARFAVFGQPIAHSLSPTIHRRFAESSGIALTYSAIEVDASQFAEAFQAFRGGGGRGANVTLPHKSAALKLCDRLAASAARAGVVNTLAIAADGVTGHNTDGAGLVEDISERLRLDLRGRRTLVLGAGGAASGVLPALLDAGIHSVVIANRSPSRADQLSDRIGEPARVETCYWNDLAEAGRFDLIVNATSAGHARLRLDLPFALVGPRSLVYDLNYGRSATDFLAWGRAAGAEHVCDGLGMLVEQAAEAFAIWHGKRPETASVYAELVSQSH